MEIASSRGTGVEMFGSSNQNQVPADNAQAKDPGGLNSFTMDPPHKDAQAAPLPPEPTGTAVTDAPSAPHVTDPPIIDGPPASSKPADLPLPPPSPANPPSTLADLEASVNAPPTPVDDNKDEPTPSVDNSELLSIKTQALSQLSPLISHLDQTPEDKFKTIMMMIQANDNQELVKEAYEAAQQITDEKAKSQALLDIVNEINYFTQKNK